MESGNLKMPRIEKKNDNGKERKGEGEGGKGLIIDKR